MWFIFLFSLTQFRHRSIAFYGHCHRFWLMAQLPFPSKRVWGSFLDLVEHFWQGSAFKVRMWKWDSKLMRCGSPGRGLSASSLTDPGPAAPQGGPPTGSLRAERSQVRRIWPSLLSICDRGNNWKSKIKWSVQGQKHGGQAGSENRNSKANVHVRTG